MEPSTKQICNTFGAKSRHWRGSYFEREKKRGCEGSISGKTRVFPRGKGMMIVCDIIPPFSFHGPHWRKNLLSVWGTIYNPIHAISTYLVRFAGHTINLLCYAVVNTIRKSRSLFRPKLQMDGYMVHIVRSSKPTNLKRY